MDTDGLAPTDAPMGTEGLARTDAPMADRVTPGGAPRHGDGVTLDDPRGVRAADPAGMFDLIGSLGAQLSQGYRAGVSAAGLPSADGIHSVVVCGMGGSGIAGDVIQSLFASRLPFPLAVVKGYLLPEFCGRETVLLAVSFSGDTEETIECYTEGVARGCRVVAVSRGGRLAELARADQVVHVPLPADLPPVPRAALGYLAGALIGALEALGVTPPTAGEVERASRFLGELAAELGPERPEAGNEAKGLARWLRGRTAVLWSAEGLAAAAAVRWKTQLNENAKLPAFWSTVPELDHNEIESWSVDEGERFVGIALRHGGEQPRIAARMAATAEVLAASGLEVRDVHARGTTPLEQLFSLILLGDLVSAYVAVIRGVDPTPIPVLTELKRRLQT